jgi:hypothetical protein
MHLDSAQKGEVRMAGTTLETIRILQPVGRPAVLARNPIRALLRDSPGSGCGDA